MTGKPKNLTLSSIGIVLHRVVWPTTKHVELYQPVVQGGSVLNRLYLGPQSSQSAKQLCCKAIGNETSSTRIDGPRTVRNNRLVGTQTVQSHKESLICSWKSIPTKQMRVVWCQAIKSQSVRSEWIGQKKTLKSTPLKTSQVSTFYLFWFSSWHVKHVVVRSKTKWFRPSFANVCFLTCCALPTCFAPESNDFFFNYSFDKNRIKALLSWSLMHFGEKVALDMVEKIKQIGFEYGTRAGASLGLEDLRIPLSKTALLAQAELDVQFTQNSTLQFKVTAIERFQHLIDTWHRSSESLKKDVVQHFRSTDLLNPVYMMAFSGARGNISQVSQLVGMRGLMADPQGQIISFPIRSNFREGLTLTEYVISCYGARKGLVDTALRTANAGYLTRRLVDVSHHVIVSQFDCKTNRGIFLTPLFENGKIRLPLEARLLGRVLAQNISNSEKSKGKPVSNLQTKVLLGAGKKRRIPKCFGKRWRENQARPWVKVWQPNAEPKVELIGSRNQQISHNLAEKIAALRDKVLVRSPLSCNRTTSICRLCYGWSLSEGKLVPFGEAVGIIAAQSIGEPGTQLTMRTFHTGGVFSGDVVDEIRAPHKGLIEFSTPLQGKLVRTSHGKIAFRTKTKGVLRINQSGPLVSPTVLLRTSDEDQGKGVASHRYQDKQERQTKQTVLPQPTDATEITIPPLTVLFVRQFEEVVPNQLVAEIPVGATQIDEKVRESYKLFSELEGKVLFDTLMIRLAQRDNNKSTQKSVHLGSIWVLSGKIYRASYEWQFFPKIGDFVDQRAVLNQFTTTVLWEGFVSKLAPTSLSTGVYTTTLGRKARGGLMNSTDWLVSDQFTGQNSRTRLVKSQRLNRIGRYQGQQKGLLRVYFSTGRWNPVFDALPGKISRKKRNLSTTSTSKCLPSQNLAKQTTKGLTSQSKQRLQTMYQQEQIYVNQPFFSIPLMDLQYKRVGYLLSLSNSRKSGFFYSSFVSQPLGIQGNSSYLAQFVDIDTTLGFLPLETNSKSSNSWLIGEILSSTNLLTTHELCLRLYNPKQDFSGQPLHVKKRNKVKQVVVSVLRTKYKGLWNKQFKVANNNGYAFSFLGKDHERSMTTKQDQFLGVNSLCKNFKTVREISKAFRLGWFPIQYKTETGTLTYNLELYSGKNFSRGSLLWVVEEGYRVKYLQDCRKHYTSSWLWSLLRCRRIFPRLLITTSFKNKKSKSFRVNQEMVYSNNKQLLLEQNLHLFPATQGKGGSHQHPPSTAKQHPDVYKQAGNTPIIKSKPFVPARKGKGVPTNSYNRSIKYTTGLLGAKYFYLVQTVKIALVSHKVELKPTRSTTLVRSNTTYSGEKPASTNSLVNKTKLKANTLTNTNSPARAIRWYAIEQQPIEQQHLKGKQKYRVKQDQQLFDPYVSTENKEGSETKARQLVRFAWHKANKLRVSNDSLGLALPSVAKQQQLKWVEKGFLLGLRTNSQGNQVSLTAPYNGWLTVKAPRPEGKPFLTYSAEPTKNVHHLLGNRSRLMVDFPYTFSLGKDKNKSRRSVFIKKTKPYLFRHLHQHFQTAKEIANLSMVKQVAKRVAKHLVALLTEGLALYGEEGVLLGIKDGDGLSKGSTFAFQRSKTHSLQQSVSQSYRTRIQVSSALLITTARELTCKSQNRKRLLALNLLQTKITPVFFPSLNQKVEQTTQIFYGPSKTFFTVKNRLFSNRPYQSCDLTPTPASYNSRHNLGFCSGFALHAFKPFLLSFSRRRAHRYKTLIENPCFYIGLVGDVSQPLVASHVPLTIRKGCFVTSVDGTGQVNNCYSKKLLSSGVGQNSFSSVEGETKFCSINCGTVFDFRKAILERKGWELNQIRSRNVTFDYIEPHPHFNYSASLKGTLASHNDWRKTKGLFFDFCKAIPLQNNSNSLFMAKGSDTNQFNPHLHATNQLKQKNVLVQNITPSEHFETEASKFRRKESLLLLGVTRQTKHQMVGLSPTPCILERKGLPFESCWHLKATQLEIKPGLFFFPQTEAGVASHSNLRHGSFETPNRESFYHQRTKQLGNSDSCAQSALLHQSFLFPGSTISTHFFKNAPNKGKTTNRNQDICFNSTFVSTNCVKTLPFYSLTRLKSFLKDQLYLGLLIQENKKQLRLTSQTTNKPVGVESRGSNASKNDRSYKSQRSCLAQRLGWSKGLPLTKGLTWYHVGQHKQPPLQENSFANQPHSRQEGCVMLGSKFNKSLYLSSKLGFVNPEKSGFLSTESNSFTNSKKWVLNLLIKQNTNFDQPAKGSSSSQTPGIGIGHQPCSPSAFSTVLARGASLENHYPGSSRSRAQQLSRFNINTCPLPARLALDLTLRTTDGCNSLLLLRLISSKPLPIPKVTFTFSLENTLTENSSCKVPNKTISTTNQFGHQEMALHLPVTLGSSYKAPHKARTVNSGQLVKPLLVDLYNGFVLNEFLLLFLIVENSNSRWAVTCKTFQPTQCEPTSDSNNLIQQGGTLLSYQKWYQFINPERTYNAFLLNPVQENNLSTVCQARDKWSEKQVVLTNRSKPSLQIGRITMSAPRSSSCYAQEAFDKFQKTTSCFVPVAWSFMNNTHLASHKADSTHYSEPSNSASQVRGRKCFAPDRTLLSKVTPLCVAGLGTLVNTERCVSQTTKHISLHPFGLNLLSILFFLESKVKTTQSRKPFKRFLFSACSTQSQSLSFSPIDFSNQRSKLRWREACLLGTANLPIDPFLSDELSCMGRDLGVLARKIQSTSLLTDSQHKKIIYQSTGEKQVGISRSPFATPTSGNASFLKHGGVIASRQKVDSTNQFQHLKTGLEFSKFDSKSNKQQSIKDGREFLEKLETLVSLGVDLKVRRQSPLKSNRVLNLRKTSFILFFVQLQVPLTYTLHFGKNHILPIKPFFHKKGLFSQVGRLRAKHLYAIKVQPLLCETNLLLRTSTNSNAAFRLSSNITSCLPKFNWSRPNQSLTSTGSLALLVARSGKSTSFWPKQSDFFDTFPRVVTSLPFVKCFHFTFVARTHQLSQDVYRKNQAVLSTSILADRNGRISQTNPAFLIRRLSPYTGEVTSTKQGPSWLVLTSNDQITFKLFSKNSTRWSKASAKQVPISQAILKQPAKSNNKHLLTATQSSTVQDTETLKGQTYKPNQSVVPSKSLTAELPNSNLSISTPETLGSKPLRLNVHIGQLICYGQEIIDKTATNVPGQVLQITNNTITLRRGQPVMFPSKSTLHVHHQNLINKQTTLLTILYQRLKTGDIVQGIPKIEQLFEARQTKDGQPLPNNLADKLDEFFCYYKTKSRPRSRGETPPSTIVKTRNLFLPKVYRFTVPFDGLKLTNKSEPSNRLPFAWRQLPTLKTGIPFQTKGRTWSETPHLLQHTSAFDKSKDIGLKLWEIAVRKSVKRIQLVLVERIQRVYLSQGVVIADKHLEIVVRQMTSKVRITHGEDAGLVRNELVDLIHVERYNRSLPKFNPIKYEPAILGLTKTSLEARSFLSAASFQETNRALSKAGIQSKIDLLGGLKQKVILGQLIHAGTGWKWNSWDSNRQPIQEAIKSNGLV